uniref:Hypoxia resistant protein n=1 Tax=Oryctolagus cuniculus TaxID=9986 RepID=E2JDQ6_RABIT|nr:hypoxia resistant protein [Oryctolagus cuniculus]
MLQHNKDNLNHYKVRTHIVDKKIEGISPLVISDTIIICIISF